MSGLLSLVGYCGVVSDCPNLDARHFSLLLLPRCTLGQEKTADGRLLDGTDFPFLEEIKQSLTRLAAVHCSAALSLDNGPWAQGGASIMRGLNPADQPYFGTGQAFGGTQFSENSLFSRSRSIGCDVGLAAGSVRFLQETIAAKTLEALGPH